MAWNWHKFHRLATTKISTIHNGIYDPDFTYADTFTIVPDENGILRRTPAGYPAVEGGKFAIAAADTIHVETIGGVSVLRSSIPANQNPDVLQVAGSVLSGAGTGAVTGLLTTDTITSSGTPPTCTVDGTLTISADCWDIEVHRGGVLWAYWPGINVGGAFELDASGNGHHLYLTTTTIVEAVDGTGTNWCNERGFTVADGSQYLESTGDTRIGAGWRIPALVDGSGCAAYQYSEEDHLPTDNLVALWDADEGLVDSIGDTLRTVQPLQYIQADGTGILTHGLLTETCTMSSSNGTASPTFSTGQIALSAGTLWSFSVTWDDGAITLYEYATKIGTGVAICFDVSGHSRHLQCSGMADVDVWCASSFTTGSDWLNQRGYTDTGISTPYAVPFSLPTTAIPEADYYVSGTGSDSNDGLTANTPFLTIQYAVDTALDGDVIHILAGTYTENKNSTFGLQVQKAVSLYGIGGTARIQTTSGAYLFGFSTTGHITVGSGIELYAIDKNIVYFGSTGKCSILDAKITGSASGVNRVFYVNGDCDVEIRRTTVDVNVVDYHLWYDTGKTGDFVFTDNTVSIADLANNGIYIQSGTRQIVFTRNNISVNDMSRVTGQRSLVYLSNNTAHYEITDNTIVLPLTIYANAGHIAILVTSSLGTVATTVEASRNNINIRTLYGYGIIIGAEGSTAGNNTITVKSCYGNNVVGAGASGGAHGILVGYQSDAVVCGNSVASTQYGTVLKGDAGTSHLNGIVFGNLFNTCTFGLHVKGPDQTKLYNNSFDNCGKCISMVDNGGGVPETCDVQNNAYKLANVFQRFIDNDATSIAGFTADGNIGLSTGTVADVGATSYNFAAWQLAGYDASGQNINSAWTSTYSIGASSPCYQSGLSVTLPAQLILDVFASVIPTGAVFNVGAMVVSSVDSFGRVKYSLLDPPQWPSAPEIIAVTGVDNAVYDASGTGVVFATNDLALAAMASIADDTKLFGGIEMAALYSIDMSASASLIKHFVGD